MFVCSWAPSAMVVGPCAAQASRERGLGFGPEEIRQSVVTVRDAEDGPAWLQGEAGRAPGRIGKWLAKPFGNSERATNKSARAGRKTRSKLPF